MFPKRLDPDEYICLTHTSSRHLQNVLQRCLQEVFKTYYQVKLFFVTQFQDVFETYSKRFWDVLLRRLSTGGLPKSHVWEIYGQCTKFPRVIKVSQVLVFTLLHLLVAPYRDAFRTWLNIYNGDFFPKIPNGVKLLTIFARKGPSLMSEWVENRLVAKGFKCWAHFCTHTANKAE